jgi:hypothetical protein
VLEDSSHQEYEGNMTITILQYGNSSTRMTCTITLAGDHGEKVQEIKNECGRFLWPCSSGISLT